MVILVRKMASVSLSESALRSGPADMVRHLATILGVPEGVVDKASTRTPPVSGATQFTWEWVEETNLN